MLTRAKSIEIVVGNPQTLKQDPVWCEFVDYCVSNGGLISGKSKHTEEADEKIALLLKEMKEM